jgi:predicted PurR-regulated permease PerM
MASSETPVSISNRTILRIIFLTIFAGVMLQFINNILHPLTLIFVAFFLALALNPAVSWISRRLKSKSRVRATAVAYVIVLSLLVGFFSLIIPPLVRQTSDFVKTIPGTIENLKTQDSTIGRLVRKYNLNEQIDELASNASAQIKELDGPLISTANRIIANIVSIITVLVLTFMMLVEGPFWLGKFWEVMPEKKRDHHKKLASSMYQVITNYVNGQVIIALIAGSFALVALLIAGTIFQAAINEVALAGIIALMALVPMIGNIIGAIVVVFVCLFTSLPLAITMLVFFLVYQQVENITIQPYIQSRNNSLTPLLVFIAALLGIGFGGLLGGFVSIPLAGCLAILVEDIFKQRRLKFEKNS